MTTSITTLLAAALQARRLANEAEAKALATPEALEHRRLRDLAQKAEAELQQAMPKTSGLTEADGFRAGWRARNAWSYNADALRQSVPALAGEAADEVLEAAIKTTEAVDKAALEKALKPLGEAVLTELRAKAGSCSTTHSWVLEQMREAF